MAERVLDKVVEKMTPKAKAALKDCYTDKIPLMGNGFKNSKAVQKYLAAVQNILEQDGLSRQEAWHLVTNYGKQTEEILKNYKLQKEALGQQNTSEASLNEKQLRTALVLAELEFGCTNEMVTSPEDFYIRRTGRLYFDIDSISLTQEAVYDYFEKNMSWGAEQLKNSQKSLRLAMEEHSDFSMDRAYQ